ncbi:hypothetical protein PENNAL_c0705G11747, partial [Penicillium nalgiovense]
PVARAVPDATEETLAEFLFRDLYAYYGLLRARYKTTTPYHPRTNRKDKYLTKVLFAARVREHTITRESLYFLVYGVHPRIIAGEDSPLDG